MLTFRPHGEAAGRSAALALLAFLALVVLATTIMSILR
jgi:hypothetical protein